MEFFTPIDIPKAKFNLSHEDTILLLGSCFAENMGQLLETNKFDPDINPFGTLYNPLSICESLKLLLQAKPFTPDQLFEYKGLYHSFSHHSRFSGISQEECLTGINVRLEKSAKLLVSAKRLIVTWGSAYVYQLKENGVIVSNCHKLPEKLFIRKRLTAEEIAAEWKDTLSAIWEQNPELKVILTVSPIRHWKDGAHANQLSKSILLLAAEKLEQMFPEQIGYFPSYEIMLDELRDYRFYAEDMIHPSASAINYIWEKFADHFFSKETHLILQTWEELRKAINHKPFQPQSKSYQNFLLQTLLKMERLNEKFPFFDIKKELDELRKRSNDYNNEIRN